MNIINPHRLEDFIVKLLMSGGQNSTLLLSHIRGIRKDTTKQGFYAALRKLKSEEIVLTYKGTVSLGTVWINKMRDLLEDAGKVYVAGKKSFDILDLEDRESISYSFSNIKNLDIFWGHSQNIIMHNTTNTEPIYAYDPHYWFYIAHKETEIELLKEIVKHKRQFLMTVGHSTFLDKTIKKNFNGNYLQYNFKKMFNKDNYYVTVIGDYINEVILDEGVSRKINEVYLNTNEADDVAVNQLQELLESKVRCKIKISRNKKRASELKKKMGKDFYVIRK